MTQQAKKWEDALQEFRAYLEVVAKVELDPRLQGKIDLSGVIQQTLLEAHHNQEPMRDWAHKKQANWVRKAFTHNLIDEIRKPPVRRERSLNEAAEQSSGRLQDWLQAEQSTPSQIAQRDELELQVAGALAKLLEPEREAVILQNWHGWTLAQIASHLDRTPGAVAGLLHRGLEKLKKELHNLE